MERFTREPKYRPLRIAVVTGVVLVMVAVLSLSVASRSSTPEKEPFTPTGYYSTSTGIFDASNKEEILLGDYLEFVRTEDYLLAVNGEGTLTLLSLIDHKVKVIVGNKETAHQLKIVDGNKFGFLQLDPNADTETQVITILDPRTGNTSTNSKLGNIISWNAEGSDVIYMPNETTIIHHTTYQDGAWGKGTILGENLSSIGNMFVKDKQLFVQVLADVSKLKVISLKTFTDQTKDFPVAGQIGSLGTVSQVIGNYWFVTTPTSSMKVDAYNKVTITALPDKTPVIEYSQLLLEGNSTLLYNFAISGYESLGISSLNADSSVLNVPVSLAGSGERGVLFIDTKTNTVISFLNSALNYIP